MIKFYLKNKKKIIPGITTLFFAWLLNKLFDFISSKINYNETANIIIASLKYKVSFSIQFILLLIVIFFIVYNVFKKLKGRILNKKGFFIVSAKYGANGKYIDIKDELNNKIERGQLNVVLDNSIAGDPIFGVEKECEVSYSYNGRLLTKTYKESDTIKLPNSMDT